MVTPKHWAAIYMERFDAEDVVPPVCITPDRPQQRSFRRPVALDIGQRTDALTLKASVQCRTRQMRERWLKRIETVVERQQRVAPEGDDDRHFLDRQHRSFGPVGRSTVELRPRHLATVVWLIPLRLACALRLS